MHGLFDGLVPKLDGGAVNVSTLRASPGVPHGEAGGIVVASGAVAVARFGEFDPRWSAEFSAPEQGGFVERSALMRVRARRGERSLLEPDAGSVILGQPPGAPGVVMSPAAAQAAADEQTLGAAREKLDRSLRGVNVAEQRSLRGLRRRLTREGRAGEYEREAAPVRARYEQLRAGHRADYQQTCSRVLGRPD